MPVYNAERYLEAALESLLAQTFTDFELIISDNASTDATAEICRRYTGRDARIRYERQRQNRGANWNFNRVVELARGELFKWAAYDDLCEPTFIERCVAALDADPGIVAAHTRTIEIGPTGRLLHRPDAPADRPHNPAGPPALAASPRADLRFRDVLLNHGWGVRSFGVIRTEPLRRTGLYQPAYGWEKIIMAELALVGRFHLVDEPLFQQRVHPDAMSQLAASSSRLKALAAHYDGRALPRLAYLRGYLRVAWRSRRSLFSFLLCAVWTAAWVLQVRKWPAVLASMSSRLTPRLAIFRARREAVST